MDTTKVIARINGLTIPEDIDWKVNKIGFAKVPVPDGVLLENFAMSLWNLPYVLLAKYNTYGEPASDPAGIITTYRGKTDTFKVQVK